MIINTKKNYPQARGLIIIVFDTLRKDYESFSKKYGLTLKNLPRLKTLCSIKPQARCGSFPTVPFRTDLLTGRLSFLSDEWARPFSGEETLLSLSRNNGYRTTLVTDNYVTIIPKIGGLFLDEFDTVDFVRGVASDPWSTPSKNLLEQTIKWKKLRPTRDYLFEAQFISNVNRWLQKGQTPFRQLFNNAIEHLTELIKHDRFLLWLDFFAFHEPWISYSKEIAYNNLLEIPFFPKYIEKSYYSKRQLTALKKQYVQRLSEIDEDIEFLIDAIEYAVSCSDIALAVLSDHGFLFGEFGFVGKPANTPLPPELHEIICWLSPHFSNVDTNLKTGIQPHMLHREIRRVLGIPGKMLEDQDIQIFARNSPHSNYVTAVNSKQLLFLEKNNGYVPITKTIERGSLNSEKLLVSQGTNNIDSDTRLKINKILLEGRSPWLRGFCTS